jgi:hypothetical protein
MKNLRNKLLHSASFVLQYLQLPILFAAAMFIRCIKRKPAGRSRKTVFGGVGMISFARWSDALNKTGYASRTVVWSTPTIYPSDVFDRDIKARWGNFSGIVAPVIFLQEIRHADTIVCGFDGFILGLGSLRRFEFRLLKLAGCKTVVVPYGADSYVYSQIRSEDVAHVLQISYPEAARRQRSLSRDVSGKIEQADFVFLGLMTFDGFGRWDALPFNAMVVDLDRWIPRQRDWQRGVLKVVHAPNHRGFKGTEFIVEAVERLKSEGLQIELVLLEGLPNDQVREVFSSQAHVLVEQLIAPGYAMNGVEGLASGLVVIANLSDERLMRPMRRWSFASECPIVSANPETIYDVLKHLTSTRDQLEKIGNSSRQYAEKFHSAEAFSKFFTSIDEFLWDGGERPINFFHPLLGNFAKSFSFEQQSNADVN